MRFAHLLILAILAVMAMTPTANAGPTRVEQARAIALERSGPVCQGAVVPIGRSDSVRGLARASYKFPAGLPDDRAGYFDCTINFRPGRIPWPEFCSAMVHEYLHLAGWRAVEGKQFVSSEGVQDRHHSSDPKSIMFVRVERIYAQCRQPPSSGVGGEGLRRLPPTVNRSGEHYSESDATEVPSFGFSAR